MHFNRILKKINDIFLCCVAWFMVSLSTTVGTNNQSRKPKYSWNEKKKKSGLICLMKTKDFFLFINNNNVAHFPFSTEGTIP